jgi:DNA-binding beta-propeller fold protein YncE
VQIVASSRLKLAPILAAALLSACASPGGSVPSAVQQSVPAAGHTSTRTSPHFERTSIGKFGDPYGVAVNPACSANCDVYVADPGSKTIWRVQPDGTRTAIGDFSSVGNDFDPQGVAVSPLDGSIYVADKEPLHKRGLVWRINNGSTSEVSGFAFNGLSYPRAVTVGPKGEVYVAIAARVEGLADTGLQCVGRCWFSGRAGTGSSYGVGVDAAQNTYVAAAGFKVIFRRVPSESGFDTWLTVGDPYGVAVSWTGGHVAIADPGNKRVWLSVANGSLEDLGAFADPYGVAVDSGRNVYVADAGSKDVWKIAF